MRANVKFNEIILQKNHVKPCTVIFELNNEAMQFNPWLPLLIFSVNRK